MKIALISDLHANIHALKVVLNDLNDEGVNNILVAGDLIGYYYWCREIVELLMLDNRFICVRGNHENILQETLVNDEAIQRYQRKYGSGYEACRQQLSEAQMDWLLSLPEEVCVDFEGVKFYMRHGALDNNNKYLYPDSPLERLLENYSNAKYTVFGHTHYPFLHEHNGRYLLNPGSVGQPRDAGGMASYVVINTDNQVIRFKRKVFDTEPVIHAARKNDPELGYLADIMSR